MDRLRRQSLPRDKDLSEECTWIGFVISTIILTKDEEKDLPDCLQSVAWSGDVHIFDSYSSDRTVEIATDHGAHVSQRHFDNYAAQRNAALDLTSFKHEWVLF